MPLQTNMRLHEQLLLVATIDPQTVANSAKYSDAIDMSKFRRVMAVFATGDMAAETIDCLLQSDTVSTFDDSAATVKAATQLSASATANDGKQIIIEVNAEDLPDGDQYLRAKMVTGNSSGGPSTCLIFAEPRFSNEADLSSVVEIAVA